MPFNDKYGPVSLIPPVPISMLTSGAISDAISCNHDVDGQGTAATALASYQNNDAQFPANLWFFYAEYGTDEIPYQELLSELCELSKQKLLLIQNRRAWDKVRTAKIFKRRVYDKLYDRSLQLSVDLSKESQPFREQYLDLSPVTLLYELAWFATRDLVGVKFSDQSKATQDVLDTVGSDLGRSWDSKAYKKPRLKGIK